ncbi:amino acid adenylation domain-containing protein/non-ribosomal peptide synthase protein (TIGR01720 family) [Chromobacterium alkanivorans]|uniref:jagaricin-like haemolysin non-ribosomal peptide synthetase HmlB n=1 Tax=Chromobacterium alkanivorans TaxID=1071719 RepID=UPI002166ED80|nr:non-ribosomal peptide synthetase [Chromobacterium alkanivorans]MCS3805174.1 amino acid adenylation domain-containing protein/non-ribosomal peptide synthase protein (TIGR01720 family) [Chromobacterium alkanivorans]MCS3819263.1 amino acid adenylation domain-containing protein/non-ribosomal peptide synthase protein (TIGR01720 family) [Chromobacterium alkanivorans]MCS3873775.1 amino acid adenylation domain-containing protein/non-ribosomal peptide synthase protein (TIGR01720 family) [Chromobacteri
MNAIDAHASFDAYVFPQSGAQRRLWTLADLAPDSTAYHIPLALRLRGALDPDALQAALNALVARHEILRTQYDLVDGEPCQLIRPQAGCELPRSACDEAGLAALLRAEAALRFDLRRDPVIRARLFVLGPQHHVLSIVIHHIACDGWSLGVLVRELGALYPALAAGLPEPALPEALQYADFSEWERETRAGGDADALDYWRERLAGLDGEMELPGDFAAGQNRSEAAGHVSLTLPAALTETLRAQARAADATLFMALLSGFQALLQRLSGRDEVCVGSPVANRDRAEFEQTLGFFVNTLILRQDLSGAPSFAQLLARNRADCLNAFAHQHAPFDQVVKLAGPRAQAQDAPFRALFALQNAPLGRLDWRGVEAEALPLFPADAKFDLSLMLEPAGDGLRATLEYRAGLIGAGTAARWLEHYRELLQAAAAQPDCPLARLPLPSAEQAALAQGPLPAAITPPHPDLCSWFEHAAQAFPERVAVQGETAALRYRELDARANQLARQLQQLGVQPEQRVGLCCQRQPDLLVAILAILKAGAAYVPLDPGYPAERLEFLVRDSAIHVVVGDAESADALPAGLALRWLDVAVSSGDDTPPPRRLHPQQAAYVIYTSGSTGTPKGCVVSHHNVVRLIAATSERFAFGPDDVWSLFHSYAFDFSVWEIWGPLLFGGSCLVVPYWVSRSPEAFAGWLQQHRVSVLNQTPAAFRQLIPAAADHALPDLRLVIFGGEALELASLEPWFRQRGDQRPELVNMYGITETTVHVTQRAIRQADLDARRGQVIGQPIPDLAFHLLDRFLQPVPIGVPGEIYVGGPGVARGYWNRPGLTAARFLPNPFAADGSRLYRSGDLARRRADGEIEYLGRADHQVKLRGFRIELGEIETALCRLPAVREALVLLDRPAAGEPRLIAYVVGDGEPAALRAALAAELPEHMLPAVIVALERFPLTHHGKVDRAALPAAQAASDAPRVEPRSDAERALARIWAEVLAVPLPGIDDNFFALGGDSILSLQVVARARAQGLALSPRQLLLEPSIRQLAAILNTAAAEEEHAAAGPLPATPIQRWFAGLDLAEPRHWNQALALQLAHPVDPARLQAALDAVAARHDAFRLRFAPEPALADAAGGWPCRELELADESEQAARAVIAQAQRELDPNAGPLARALLLRRGRQAPLLALIVHHLAVDAVSWGILLDDLGQALDALARGEAPRLAAVPANWRRWAERQRADAAEADPTPWLSQAAAGFPTLRRDAAMPAANTEAGSRLLSRELDTALTGRLLRAGARAAGQRVSALLLLALWRALAPRLDAPRFAVTMEHHGRDAESGLDLSRTVGWFTALYPLSVAGDAASVGAAELLAAIAAPLSRLTPIAPEYGQARWLGPDQAARRQLDAAGLPEISFNYLGAPRALDNERFQLRPELIAGERAAANLRPFALDLVLVVLDGRLRVDWRYAGGQFEPASVAGWADAFARELALALDEIEAAPLLAADYPLARLEQAAVDELARRAGPFDDLYPLSPLQQGMLFHSVADAADGAYLEQLSSVVDGELDPDAFADAWRAMLARHPLLRSSFHWRGLAQPLQAAMRAAPLPISRLDWSGLAEPEAALADYLAADAARPFALDAAPLMRLALIRLGERRWRWIWSYHHLLLDGWSLPLFFRELLTLYRALSHGETPALPPARPFSAYIGWLDRAGRRSRSDERFWRRYFSGLEQPTLLAGPAGGGADFVEREIRLSPEWSARAAAAMQACASTLNTLFQAAWALTLARSGHGEDIVFGSALSGRNGDLPGIDEMIGLFINTLPLRVRLNPAADARALLAQVQAGQARVQDYAHNRLVDVQRWAGRDNAQLFDTLLVFENYPADAMLRDEAAGLGFETPRFSEHTNYPLTLAVIPGAALSVKLTFDRSRVADAAAEELLQRWLAVAERIVAAPDAAIAAIELLPAEARRTRIADAAQPPLAPPQLAQRLFEDQAALSPRAAALLDENGALDYAGLDARANRLAHRLQALGAGPEVVVGVLLPRGADAVTALLATLKAGAVYLPLDPAYPAERLDYMLADSGAAVLLSESSRLPMLSRLPARLLLLDEAVDAPDTAPPCAASIDNLAYLIYTSGSTGWPKGVGVSHRGIANLCRAQCAAFQVDAASRVYQFAPLSFDASVSEIFMALGSGAALCLPDADAAQDPAGALRRAALRHGLSHATLPPALLAALDESELPGLRTLIAAGEAAAPGLLARWAAARRVLNAYGPTEATVCASIQACDAVEPLPSIGSGMAGVRLYLLDRWGGLVPPGVPGELHIGGEALARGYIGQPGRTAASFVPDAVSGLPGARLYRSGDLGEYLPDGGIRFLGRAGGQVKLRGYRIELDGVAAALSDHPDVDEALALIRRDGERSQLVAYARLKPEAETDAAALRAHLAARLPAHELPQAIVQLRQWPLTPAGKIDRAALPPPEEAAPASPDAEQALNPAEAALLEIWRAVLGRNGIGVHDNYFAAGGDSILALQIVSRAKQAGFDIEPRALFAHPTVAGLAAAAGVAARRAHIEEPEQAEAPLAPIQRWFLQQDWPAPQHWNLSLRLSLDAAADPAALQAALTATALRHDALRLRLRRGPDGVWSQHYGPRAAPPLETLTLRATTPAEREAELQAHGARLQASLDLEQGPLLRAVLVEAGPDGRAELLLIAHHWVLDVVSWRILLDDLDQAYGQAADGAEIALPPVAVSYRAWAQSLADSAPSLSGEFDYWRAAVAPLAVPPGLAAVGRVAERRRATISLDADASAALLEGGAERYRAQPQELLLAALTLAWRRLSGQPALALDLESHGRGAAAGPAPDLSRSVGWFTCLHPLRVEPAGDGWEPAAAAAKAALRGVPGGGIGFGVLRYLGDPARAAALDQAPPRPLSFNYLGRLDDAADGVLPRLRARLSPREAGPAQDPRQRLPHAVAVNARIEQGRLRLDFDYADAHQTPALAEQCRLALEELAALCRASGQPAVAYHTSDFAGVALEENELAALLDDLTDIE